MSRLLLLDFDGTITQHDTLNTLVSLAIASDPQSPDPGSGSGPNPNPTPGTTTDNNNNSSNSNNNHNPSQTQKQTQTQNQQHLTALWSEIVRDYVAAHEAHRAAYHTPAERRTTLGQELACLESVEHGERASVGRVGKGGFFRGLGGAGHGGGGGGGEGDRGVLEGIGRRAVGCFARNAGEGDGEDVGAAGAVKLRKGFGEFLGVQGDRGWDLAVVSVNWSGEFIKGVVEGGCELGQGSRVRKVVANGIGYPDGRVEGPSELGGEPLVTAGDKLRAMKSLREGMEEERVVYFGDSTTDLACLVEADLGVVMADDGGSKLLKTLERINFTVPHVGEAGAENKLVWARDFEEVLQSGVMDRI
jgi:2-hydroxy-3-keto-5-methylthiopentenyl-1-phosphate phosphatase